MDGSELYKFIFGVQVFIGCGTVVYLKIKLYDMVIRCSYFLSLRNVGGSKIEVFAGSQSKKRPFRRLISFLCLLCLLGTSILGKDHKLLLYVT